MVGAKDLGLSLLGGGGSDGGDPESLPLEHEAKGARLAEAMKALNKKKTQKIVKKYLFGLVLPKENLYGESPFQLDAYVLTQNTAFWISFRTIFRGNFELFTVIKIIFFSFFSSITFWFPFFTHLVNGRQHRRVLPQNE